MTHNCIYLFDIDCEILSTKLFKNERKCIHCGKIWFVLHTHKSIQILIQNQTLIVKNKAFLWSHLALAPPFKRQTSFTNRKVHAKERNSAGARNFRYRLLIDFQFKDCILNLKLYFNVLLIIHFTNNYTKKKTDLDLSDLSIIHIRKSVVGIQIFEYS